MKKELNYVHIESQIDCLQNLLIMLCQQNHINIEFLYFLWPWEFLCKNSNDGKLSIDITDVVDSKKLHEYFNVDFKQCFFENAEELLEQIEILLSSDISVIVSTDQFYIPYHYPHIFGFKHGLHSVQLCKINENETVSCISSIPKFTGSVEYSKIKQAILSNKIKHWYATISFDSCQSISMQNAWIKYQKKIKSIVEKDYKSPICYTSEIYNLLKSIWDLSENKLKDELVKICDGTWGWQITRKGSCFSNLLSIYAYHAEESIGKIIQLVDGINQKWELSFKLLFMQSQTGKINKRPLTILEEIVNMEKELSYLLLELPDFYFIKQGENSQCLVKKEYATY